MRSAVPIEAMRNCETSTGKLKIKKTAKAGNRPQKRPSQRQSRVCSLCQSWMSCGVQPRSGRAASASLGAMTLVTCLEAGCGAVR